MVNLIIETDMGHDPDDFFAICWLAAIGVNIRAITLVPGDADQIALVRLLQRELDFRCPVGVSKMRELKNHPAGMHHDLLARYDFDPNDDWKPDGYGLEVVTAAHQQYPDAEFFVIGPVSSVGRYLRDNPNTQIGRATMQGGFLGYDLHHYPCKRLEKFEGKEWQPTFNLNGDRPAALWFMGANITIRRFVPKNVTHTILYNGEIHRQLRPHNRAGELFKEAMDIYLSKHPEKKFHDPAAAVLHLCPHIGSWVRGKIKKMESGWGTELDENGDFIAADIDYEKFWNLITTFQPKLD